MNKATLQLRHSLFTDKTQQRVFDVLPCVGIGMNKISLNNELTHLLNKLTSIYV